MIATGRDVRPLECVFFLRDVKSWAYFEQMKGRGARTVGPDEIRAVTPDVTAKERFVIVDTELHQLAGQTITEIVESLSRVADPDQIEAAYLAGPSGERKLVEQAVRPLADPELRQRLLQIRRAHDIVYDEVNPDTLIETRGMLRGETTERVIDSWRDYINQHRDELTALELAYRHGTTGRGVYLKLKELAARLARPPYQWTPDILWDAYVQLGTTAEHPGTHYGPVDLIGLLRYELGVDEEPRPHRTVIEERFAAWLTRQHQAGVTFTTDQMWWLERIRDVIITSASFTHDDLELT